MLVWAVNHQDTSLVRYLVEHGANPEVKDNRGRTPLVHAISTDQAGMVELLVRLGADVNTRDKREQTPLMLAAAGGDTALVRLLVENGADVNATTRDGISAINFHPADPEANAEIQRILIGAGASYLNDWKIALLALILLGGIGAAVKLFWDGRGGLRR